MHELGDEWLSVVADGSDMGRAALEFDWSATPLGPPASWPEGLRSAVSICLTTSFPACVLWGPDQISIYNDAFRPIVGTVKHPGALGRQARDVWPEVWDYVGPMLESVTTSGRPMWEQDFELVLERNGFPEACHLTFSCSPLFDDGDVGGVLGLVVETTDQVVTARHLACLSTLNARLTSADQVTDVCLVSASALGGFPADVRFADVYLRVGDQLVLVAATRRGDVRLLTADQLGGVVDGKPVVLGDDGTGETPADVVAVPIGGPIDESGDDVPQGVLVIGLNRRRPFDQRYRHLIDTVADAVTSALDRSYRRTELDEFRRVSDTLQEAMLPPAQDLATIAARYLPTVGSLAVGGDWYDVIDLDDHRRALVVGDCVGHGLAAATVMGQLRSAARAMLLEGRSPAEALSGLDAFAAQVDGALCTTVVCAVFDRTAGEITYASAGHPPALIVGSAGHRWLDGPSDPPLAVKADLERCETTLAVTDDEVIVLYSDGLIERRGETLDVGMARFARVATALHGAPAQEIADGILQQMLPGAAADDIVLVVKHLRRGAVP